MLNCKRVLGVVATLSLLTTAPPANAGGFSAGHRDYNVSNNQSQTVTQATPIQKTREATTAELNGEWTKNKNNGKWTYHLSDGTPYTGWLNDNGNWYYIKWDEMIANHYAEGYYLGSDGILTAPPATSSYGSRTITPQDVEATKNLREKLLKEGWVDDYYTGCYWGGDEVTLNLQPNKTGTHYETECNIVAGVATVTLYKELVSNSDYNSISKNRTRIPLDKYLEYKKEGKISWFTEYFSMGGGPVHYEYAEYIKADAV